MGRDARLARAKRRFVVRPLVRIARFVRWARPLVIFLVALTAARSSIADWHDVPTQSMEPTILAGDRIAVNKLAYGLKVPFTTTYLAHWDEPAANELVVFFDPVNGTRMVKRVIAGPGDRVELRRNRLLVNGEAVPAAPVTAAAIGADDLSDAPPHVFAREQVDGSVRTIMTQPARRARRSFSEVVVPAGHYFVMGDNRDNSGDSRVFGFVPRDRIVGRVTGVALSFDKDGGYRPRWGRFARGVK
jgi:signal peptidase I